MARKDEAVKSRRNVNPISLAFLDVMSCGFGAVVLIFLILDHSTSQDSEQSNPELAGEIELLIEEIAEGEEGLTAIRNTISDIDMEMVEAQGLAEQIQEEIDEFLAELAILEADANASDRDLQELRDEIAALELELETLRAEGLVNLGNDVREFLGDGNRQYLTGMLMGGNRILILIDRSASMLDDTIVNIIRRRNMSEEAQRNAEKWVQVTHTIDWLTSQLPAPSRYQMYVFNDSVEALTPNTEGLWLEVADREQLDSAVVRLKEEIIPQNGTNLENLFISIQGLNPLPDNIFLITDGLPTLDNRNRNRTNVTGRERERLFDDALQELPRGIPVNIIMAPLEGDPMAASLYWKLAIATGGSYMSPSSDWP
jgi:hypothetical protein